MGKAFHKEASWAGILGIRGWCRLKIFSVLEKRYQNNFGKRMSVQLSCHKHSFIGSRVCGDIFNAMNNRLESSEAGFKSVVHSCVRSKDCYQDGRYDIVQSSDGTDPSDLVFALGQRIALGPTEEDGPGMFAVHLINRPYNQPHCRKIGSICVNPLFLTSTSDRASSTVGNRQSLYPANLTSFKLSILLMRRKRTSAIVSISFPHQSCGIVYNDLPVIIENKLILETLTRRIVLLAVKTSGLRPCSSHGSDRYRIFLQIRWSCLHRVVLSGWNGIRAIGLLGHLENSPRLIYPRSIWPQSVQYWSLLTWVGPSSLDCLSCWNTGKPRTEMQQL